MSEKTLLFKMMMIWENETISKNQLKALWIHRNFITLRYGIAHKDEPHLVEETKLYKLKIYI